MRGPRPHPAAADPPPGAADPLPGAATLPSGRDDREPIHMIGSHATPLRIGDPSARIGIMRFLIRVIVNAFAIWVVSLITVLQVTVTPYPPGGMVPLLVTLLAIGAVFAVVNTIVGTVVKIVAFPLYILTLGLISLVINGFLLWLTAWITGFWGWGLALGGFGWTIVAAFLIAVINAIFNAILRPQRQRSRDR
jgi:putative membrane protein